MLQDSSCGMGGPAWTGALRGPEPGLVPAGGRAGLTPFRVYSPGPQPRGVVPERANGRPGVDMPAGDILYLGWGHLRERSC